MVVTRARRQRRTVVGLAVSATAVRAVAVQDARITWSAECVHGADSSFEDALAAVLDSVPRPVIGWPRVVAAAGPTYSHLRRLDRVPELPTERMLSSLIRHNASRFFAVDGASVVTTGIQRMEDGGIWAGVIDRRVVDAIVSACGSRRQRLLAISPTAAVLCHALASKDEGGTIAWLDEGLMLRISYQGDRLAHCRRVLPDTSAVHEQVETVPHAALSGLEGDGRRYADALGAALSRGATPLGVRGVHGLVGGSAPSRLRLAAAAFVCTAGMCLLSVAPGLAGWRTARSAERQVALLGPEGKTAVRDMSQLDSAVLQLHALQRLMHRGRSPVFTLAALTDAIENETMLLSLRTDSLGGTLIALTPRAGDLLTMLESVPQVATAAISGSVTSEAQRPRPVPAGSLPSEASMANATDGDRSPLERVTVRFTWRRPGHGGSR